MVAPDGKRAWLIDYGKVRRVLDTDREETLAQLVKKNPETYAEVLKQFVETKWLDANRKTSVMELEDLRSLLDVFNPDLWGTLAGGGSMAAKTSTDDRVNMRRPLAPWMILKPTKAPQAQIRGIILHAGNELWILTDTAPSALLQTTIQQRVARRTNWRVVWKRAKAPMSSKEEAQRLLGICTSTGLSKSMGGGMQRLVLKHSPGLGSQGRFMTIQTIATPRAVITIVRDDLLCGGSKSRMIPALVKEYPKAKEFVYASSWFGGAQIALPAGLGDIGRLGDIRATIVTEDWKTSLAEMPVFTHMAQTMGAKLLLAPTGQTYRTADAYVAEKPSERILLPSGFDSPGGRAALTAIMRDVKDQNQQWDECWSVCGSGTLQRCLQAANVAKVRACTCRRSVWTFPRLSPGSRCLPAGA